MSEPEEKLADVEKKVRRARTRSNLSLLQHYFYVAGSVTALSATALVVCAWQLSPGLFALVTWSLLVLTGILWSVCLYRGRRRWTNIFRTACRIDSASGLRDRLSTLIAYRVRPPGRSSLWEYLIADNLAHLSDWEMKRAVPPWVPRSVFPFAVSLLCLFAVSLPFLSPPLPSNRLPEDLGALPRALEGRFSAGGGKQKDHHAMIREKDLSLAEALPAALQKRIRQSLAPSPREIRSARPWREGLRRAQEFLPPPVAGPAQEGENFPMEAKGTVPGPEGEGGKGPRGTGPPPLRVTAGAGVQQLEGVILHRIPNPEGLPPGLLMSQGGTGSGEGGSGAGTGADPRLFGSPQKKLAPTGTFQLALDTAGSKDRKGDKEKGRSLVEEKATGTLHPRQIPDDFIRQSPIPPEYQDIVKDIFSRNRR